jgi:hypothetical protein
MDLLELEGHSSPYTNQQNGTLRRGRGWIDVGGWWIHFNFHNDLRMERIDRKSARKKRLDRLAAKMILIALLGGNLFCFKSGQVEV